MNETNKQMTSLRLSSSPDPNHHHRVMIYFLGVLFLLAIGGGVGYLIGKDNIVQNNLSSQTNSMKEETTNTLIASSLDVVPSLDPRYQ